jgi:hypothetical protein
MRYQDSISLLQGYLIAGIGRELCRYEWPFYVFFRRQSTGASFILYASYKREIGKSG